LNDYLPDQQTRSVIALTVCRLVGQWPLRRWPISAEKLPPWLSEMKESVIKILWQPGEYVV